MIVSSGIACGILLGVIEGVGVLMQRVLAEGQREWTVHESSLCRQLTYHPQGRNNHW